jgi:small conductance mechanosensitive channel
MEITMESVREFAERHVVPVAVDLLFGAIVFFVGRWVARRLIAVLSRVMETSRMDTSLRKFLADLLYALLLAAVVIMSLDTMGIRTTAVVAVLGAAGLAVGLALQGSLSNFAAGVMIIVLRHYKVGDLVVIGKYMGRVDSIKVFHTILVTADHREITIPNGQIISQPIENMTVLGMRRVDIQVTVAHGADLRDLRRDLEQAIASDVRIALSPAPTIELFEVGADALKLSVRPWTQVDNYQAVAVDTIERIRDKLDDRDYKFTVALQVA